jgi:hypothetical protein
MTVSLTRPRKPTHIIIIGANKIRVIAASELHRAMNFEELISAREQIFAGTQGMSQYNVFCLEEDTDHGDGVYIRCNSWTHLID